MCCSSWDRKESDMTELLSRTDTHEDEVGSRREISEFKSMS